VEASQTTPKQAKNPEVKVSQELEDRRAKKKELLMQMSEDHKIDEDPHLEDQVTSKISPEKKNPIAQK
jgi:hypothetical protein